MKKITKLISKPIQRVVNLNKVHWKSRITAGLINWDQFLLSTKIMTRVEGQYVTFKIHFTRDNSLFTLKIKVSTFKNIYAKFQKIAEMINIDSKTNV